MGKNIDDEVLLAIAKQSGGGGGGTSDYTDLLHKPQINGHTLEGNKTTGDLGIKFEDLPDAPTIPNDLADLQDDSSHRLVTDTEKATWDGKSDFSGAYADLTGLPTLGTASAKNVPASGDAGNSEVVLGSDSRLTNSRPASDVSSWAKQSTKPTYTSNEVGAIATTQKGVASGVAELDSNGKVPSSQLPSYVDDVIEGYYDTITDRFYTESTFENVIPPESGKSWVDVASNKSYRWTGSVYSRVDEGVQLGETSGSAYRGDRGKVAYDHSQTVGNPHGTTAADVGLDNVPNVSTNDQEPTFTEATTRNNIASGEKLSVILGKVQKFFNDLKTVAFSGSYTDLRDKPTIPTSASGITYDNTDSGLAATDVQGVVDELATTPRGYEVIATFTGDGVKTYGDVITAFLPYISQADLLLDSGQVYYPRNYLVYFSVNMSSEGIFNLYGLRLDATNPQWKIISVSVGTEVDYLTTVVPSGRVIQLCKKL